MRPVVLALVALSLPTTAAGARDPRAADRAAIIAAEQAWGRSFVTGDVATVKRLVDDGFLATDIDGSRYTKAQMIGWIRTGPPITANTTSVTALHFWGDTAVAQGEDHTIGAVPDRKPGVRIWTDTWVKRAGRWRIVGSHDMRPPPPR